MAATGGTELSFREFDELSRLATSSTWLSDADEGLAFPVDVQQVMSYVGAHLKFDSKTGGTFGVFRHGDPVAVGICDVHITEQSVLSKWIKMVRLRLRPAVDARVQEGGMEGLQEALAIFTCAVVGLLHLTAREEATTLKIYGRYNEQLNFLRLFGVELEKHSSGSYSAQLEGRFLVVTMKQQELK